LKGSKPTIETIHTKERRSVFGALSEKSFVAQKTSEKCNAQTYLEFLRYLLQKNKKVLIVIDGAKYHFEKQIVKPFYQKNLHRLKVMQLPAYSPELSPVEQVWKKIKKFLASTPWSNQEQFELKLAEALNCSTFRTKMYQYYVR
jgi:transposase